MSAPAPQDEPEGRNGSAVLPSRDGLLLGLQLCRANTMSLTRLQLALRNGDRRCALESIDRLHALDAKIERLVEQLPPPANEGSDWIAITRHLEDQKIAIAFEKLALASEISGPDMVSDSADEYTYSAGAEVPTSWPFALTRQPQRALGTRLMMGVLIALLVVVALSSIAIVASVL